MRRFSWRIFAQKPRRGEGRDRGKVEEIALARGREGGREGGRAGDIRLDQAALRGFLGMQAIAGKVTGRCLQAHWRWIRGEVLRSAARGRWGRAEGHGSEIAMMQGEREWLGPGRGRGGGSLAADIPSGQ
jgi:hypothetical protein